MTEETKLPSLLKLAPTPDSGTGDQDQGIRVLVRLLSVLAYLVAVLVIVSNTTAGQTFITRRWWIVALVVAALLSVLALPAARRWVARSTPQSRVGLVIFGIVPVVLLAVGTVLLLREEYQKAALRMIFLVVVCSLPAILYYLFMATKKYSLFNEFVTNLDRLGLLNPRRLPPQLIPSGLADETERERKNRILTYLQKFEAVYGSLPTDLGGVVLDATDTSEIIIDPRLRKTDPTGLASLFTFDTTVPVLVATALLALGWLITLPPWQGDRPTGKSRSAVAVTVSSGATQPGRTPSVDGKAAAGTAADDWLRAFTPERNPVQFAFLGAYFFSLQMLFRRYVRRTSAPAPTSRRRCASFSPSSELGWSFRLSAAFFLKPLTRMTPRRWIGSWWWDS